MEIIDNAIKKAILLRQDYANHVVYGELLATCLILGSLVLMLLARSMSDLWWVPPAVSMTIVAALAAFKEVYSVYSGKGEASGKDFLYTMYGAVLVNLVYILGVVVVK